MKRIKKLKRDEDWLEVAIYALFLIVLLLLAFCLILLTASKPRRILITSQHTCDKGIEIRTGNPEWGAEPNKVYFVIKHGIILE